MAGNEDTEPQVSPESGQSRQAPTEGQQVGSASLPAPRSFTVKERRQGDRPQEGAVVGIPLISHPPWLDLRKVPEGPQKDRSPRQLHLQVGSLGTAHPQR